MSALLIGCARCSTDAQDLTAQPEDLTRLGVTAERIYVDHGLTDTNRERPRPPRGARRVPRRDTLVVTKLDRLARSLPDARAIADELTTRKVSLKPRWVGRRHPRARPSDCGACARPGASRTRNRRLTSAGRLGLRRRAGLTMGRRPDRSVRARHCPGLASCRGARIPTLGDRYPAADDRASALADRPAGEPRKNRTISADASGPIGSV